MKRLRRFAPALTVLVVAAAVPLLRLHFFHTPSAPLGLWRAHPHRVPQVGEVARFCMGEEAARVTAGRPYAGGPAGGPCPHDTWTLAKPVAAGPGDTVVHTPEAVWINGHRLPQSATRALDAHGLPLPRGPVGTIVLRAGEFWTHSPYAEGSFDSRYLGIVRQEQLRGTVRPILTWLTTSQQAALRARGIPVQRCGPSICPAPVSCR
jgi:conjugative transfer signal peptidase TraF